MSEPEQKIFNDSVPYKPMIGSLQYAALAWRPDILEAVHSLSSHNRAPTQQTWEGCKRVVQYLKGT